MWRPIYTATYLLTTIALSITIFLSQRGIVSAWLTLPVFLMGFGVIGYYVNRSIVAPLKRLTETIDRLERGESNARILPTTKNEAGQLIQSFNQLNNKHLDRISHLKDERRLLYTVFFQMSDAVIVTDRTGMVTVVNDAAVNLLKLDRETTVGRPFSESVRHHEIIDLWKLCAEENRVQATIVDVRNGGLFLQVNVIPLDSKSLNGYVAILSDLTRVQRLETIRRDFISNISHELKTPVASLSAVIETLQHGALDDPPAAERFLKRAAGEIDTMSQMIGELLELSRIESGHVPFQFEPAPLLPIIQAVIEHLSAQIERKQLDVTIDVSADLPQILVDEARIERVIINLLHNATKFTGEGGTIRLSARLINRRAMQPYVRLAIQDSGVGIPADALPRIFERFYKIDRSRHSKGTGLGLAIAKHIMRAHNGDIWAESHEGDGSTFYLSLPVTRSE